MVIQTEEEYEKKLERVSYLMQLEIATESQDVELDILAKEVEEWEDVHHKIEEE